MTSTESTFRIAALQRGIEERDASTLLALYAEDAALRVVDRANPPSAPRVLRGHAAIGTYLEEISSRDMTHALTRIVIGDAAIAYVEECQYPNGSRVLVHRNARSRGRADRPPARHPGLGRVSHEAPARQHGHLQFSPQEQ